jgi:uncharacterized membrane protein HdeD (DUF308 family)
MSGQTATPRLTGPAASLRAEAREATGYWWLGLVAGIAWIGISLVILQFDEASITTVGVLVGTMFLLAGAQNVAIATTSKTAFGDVSVVMRVCAGLFAVLFGVSAVICFVNPEETFAGLADTLGFLFLVVGVWWMVRAFMERAVNSLWWLGLISGVLMTVIAFWTAGQFFIEKAYILLVFAGIWALMEGITAIVRAFAIRDVHQEV